MSMLLRAPFKLWKSWIDFLQGIYQLDRLYELRSCNDYLSLQRCWTTRMESSVPAARPP